MARRKFRNVQKKNKEAQKKRQIQIGVSLFFVALMVFSILGVYISDQQNRALNEFKYEEFMFTIEDIGLGQTALVTQVNGEDIPFYSLPQDTLAISTTGNVTKELGSSGYVVIGANVSAELLELIDLMRFDFDRYANVLAVSAPIFSEKEPQGLTCANATPQVPLIFIQESTQSQIIAENNCVSIQAQPNDLFVMRDRLLFSFTGIMDR